MAEEYDNLFILAVFDLCRDVLETSVPHKGIVNEVFSIEDTNKRSSKFLIFRVEEDEKAPGTTKLSEFLRNDGEM